jgi:hypothetical protein
MCVRLHKTTKNLVDGKKLSMLEKYAWIERYCIDMTTLEIFFPQSGSLHPNLRLATPCNRRSRKNQPHSCEIMQEATHSFSSGVSRAGDALGDALGGKGAGVSPGKTGVVRSVRGGTTTLFSLSIAFMKRGISRRVDN